jgi:hypothetical protein
MSLESIASIAAASTPQATTSDATDAVTSPATRAPYTVVSKNVTAIMPSGYTQTQTIKADGVETTVITNASGGTVDTIYGTSTMETSGAEVSVWA